MVRSLLVIAFLLMPTAVCHGDTPTRRSPTVLVLGPVAVPISPATAERFGKMLEAGKALTKTQKRQAEEAKRMKRLEEALRQYRAM